MPFHVTHPSIPTLFLGLFGLVGGAVAAFGLYNVWRGQASAGWPQATGIVLRSEVVDQSDSDGNSYKPGVEYRYVVNGKEWIGKRVAFGLDSGTGNRPVAARYVQRFPVGATVNVFYRPDQPGTSVLVTGITRQTFVPVAFGLGFVFFAVWFRAIWWLMST